MREMLRLYIRSPWAWLGVVIGIVIPIVALK